MMRDEAENDEFDDNDDDGDSDDDDVDGKSLLMRMRIKEDMEFFAPDNCLGRCWLQAQ